MGLISKKLFKRLGRTFMRTNRIKFSKKAKKVYYDLANNVKYVIYKRIIDGLLRIIIIDKTNKTRKSIIRSRKDEDYFFYYDLFDKGIRTK